MISLIVPTQNRDAGYLQRLIATTSWQNVPFHEVIVIDGNTDLSLAKANEKACRGARYILTPSDFNLSFFYNIGIQSTSPDAAYICCTGVDFLFAPNFVEQAQLVLNNGVEFLRSQGAILPESADLLPDWPYLVSQAIRRFPLGHAVSLAPTDWWFDVRGYDESLNLGLGVMDGDIHRRAVKSGLVQGHTLYENTQVLHQYHPRSPLKRANRPLRDLDPPIIKNLDSWGLL
ncbi:unnamed protein product [marine sediment metagenome]|uniref:Glycosyltransferase 2-like domain-containing protein n=1 Tax=marine sediment metagenome TaxID=412755 RepID=X1CVI0_9ZZZZ